MSRLKALIKDKKLYEFTIFACITIALLCSIFFVIKNFSEIVDIGLSFFGNIISAFVPLIIGLVIAYILDPLVELIDLKLLAKLRFSDTTDPIKKDRFYQRTRLASVLLTYLIIIVALLLILYGFVTLIIGQISFKSISETLNTLIAYFENYQVMIDQWISNIPPGILAEKVHLLANGIVSWIGGSFSSGGIIETIKSITGGLFNVFVGMVASIYLLKDKSFFMNLWNNLLHLCLGQKNHGLVRETLYDINGVIGTFIKGALIDSVIVAILSSVVLFVQGISFAVFIGCFAGIANIIPYFGPFLGAIPALIVATASSGIGKGVIAALSLFIVQQIDCNFIYPKIVGSSTGLHPLFVLTAVTVAGHYGGIPGMILAVPIAGIIKVFIMKWVHDD